jgi:hypothetical protein
MEKMRNNDARSAIRRNFPEVFSDHYWLFFCLKFPLLPADNTPHNVCPAGNLPHNIV